MSRLFFRRFIFSGILFASIWGFGTPVWPLATGEYQIVEKENLKGLANIKGELLIPTAYDDLGWSNRQDEPVRNVIGYKKHDLWGLLNLSNERVADPIYQELYPYSNDLLVGSKKLPYNKEIVFGILDLKGKTEVEFRYSHIEVHHNRLIASIDRNGRRRKGLIDEKERVLIPFEYNEIDPVTEGLYAVKNANDHWALMDEDGHTLIDFSLDSLLECNSDFTGLYASGKVGWLDKKSHHFILPQYKSIQVSDDGAITAVPFSKWLLLDVHNSTLDTFLVDAIKPLSNNIYRIKIGEAEALIDYEKNNLTGFKNFRILDVFHEQALFRKDGRYGVLNFDGTIKLAADYDSIIFMEEFYLVKGILFGQPGWSLLNRHGERLTKDIFDEISYLGGRFFRVRKGGYWGVVNGLGEEIIITKYDTVESYNNGRFKVVLLGEDGILDINGEWVVMPQKKEIDVVEPIRYLVRSPYGSYVYYYPKTIDFKGEYFLYWKGNGFLEVRADHKCGWVSEQGKRVIEPIYDEISPLHEDSIYFARDGKRFSFITKGGIELSRLDGRFEEIRPMSEFFIGVKIDGAWGFVDPNGDLRVANRYEDVGPYKEGRAPIMIRGKWGFIDKRETIKVQPKYDSVFAFQSGLSIVVKSGLYGLVDKEGNVELSPEYDNIIPLENGGYVIVRDGKKGLANQHGRSLFWPRFDEVYDLDNGSVIVERNQHFGLMGLDGSSPIPMIYNTLIYDPYRQLYLAELPVEPFKAMSGRQPR